MKYEEYANNDSMCISEVVLWISVKKIQNHDSPNYDTVCDVIAIFSVYPYGENQKSICAISDSRLPQLWNQATWFPSVKWILCCCV